MHLPTVRHDARVGGRARAQRDPVNPATLASAYHAAYHASASISARNWQPRHPIDPFAPRSQAAWPVHHVDPVLAAEGAARPSQLSRAPPDVTAAGSATSPVLSRSSPPSASSSSGCGSGSPAACACGPRKVGVTSPVMSKRPADDGYGDASRMGRMKAPRVGREREEEFSSVVKDRMMSNTRTGQACDRCKVRKIKCDGKPEGCTQCKNLGISCVVTDRITGRTEARGYLQDLERQNQSLLAENSDLKKLLGQKGTEVKPWLDPTTGPAQPDTGNADASNIDPGQGTGGHVFMPNFPRSKLESRPEEGHLGVGRHNGVLNILPGTLLSTLGPVIDLTSFSNPDVDEPLHVDDRPRPLYNKSIQAFTQSIMRVNPPLDPPWPSAEEGLQYVDWYFRTIWPYLPLLHKPTFMAMVTRIYNDPHFEPSAADVISVHMVFAIMYFHMGVRNWESRVQCNAFNETSNKHYHAALSKFSLILPCRKLESVQALAMVASHARAFSKPGCGAIAANMALQAAINMNLHRPWRKPEEGTNLENELRKRIWWVTVAVSMAIASRQGRPMPITVEEFDVPFPEPIADELLSEHGVDSSQQLPCNYEPALATFRIVPISIEIYSNIYSVRRDPLNYANVVRALDGQLREWENDLPDSLKAETAGAESNQLLAVFYVRTFALEARLCLRHPAVAMTKDAELLAENSRICEETARQMLSCTDKIRELKALDTTWYQLSVYTMSAFTMLVAQWKRRFQTTPAQLVALGRDMDKWMEILGETSGQLGHGPEVTTRIRDIIDRTINWIKQDMRGKQAIRPGPPPFISGPQPSRHPQNQSSHQTSTQQTPVATYATRPNVSDYSQPAFAPSNGGPNPIQHPKDYYQATGASTLAPYPTLAYGEQQQTNLTHPAFNAHSAAYYNNPANAAAAAAAAVTATPDSSTSQPDPLAAYSAQATPQIVAPSSTMPWYGRGDTYQDWNTSMMQTQDQYGANALMTLNGGARDAVPPFPTPDPAVGNVVHAGAAGEPGHVQTGEWPQLLFVHPPGG